MAEKGKGRKIGRNADWCKAYRASSRRERNKAKKLLRHIGRYGATDHCAVHCYNNLLMTVKPKDRLTITPVKTKCKRIKPASPHPPPSDDTVVIESEWKRPFAQ